MEKLRAALKTAYRSGLRFAWYMGGQKEHRGSGLTIPVCGFVSDEATLIFPRNIHLAENVLILPGARLICAEMPPFLQPSGTISIGADSIVRENAILQSYGGSITLGKSCTVNPFCLIQGNGGVQIGDNTLIASHVCIYSANHRFSDASRPIRSQGETRQGIKICSDVWIGGGAIILDGVTIGDGAVVAAGAVVNRNVAPGEVVAGVPGRYIAARGGHS